MKKRIVSVLLTTALTASLLAGCGGKSLEDQSGTQEGGDAGSRLYQNSRENMTTR